MASYNDPADLGLGRDRNNRKYKGSNPFSKILIIVAIVVIVVGLAGYGYNSLSNTYDKSLRSAIKRDENKSYNMKVYSFDELSKTSDDILKVNYVEASLKQIALGYDETEGYIATFTVDKKEYYIKTNYIVDSGDNIYETDQCITYENDVVSLGDCLESGRSYIISEPNNAIIEKDVFYKKYYKNEDMSIKKQSIKNLF